MNKREIRWRIYYADGAVFDSDDGEPWDAPATRVLMILQHHEDPRERSYFAWRDDYYIWKFGRWIAVDSDALRFYWFIEKYDHPRACMAGETVPNKIWLSTIKRAQEDRDRWDEQDS